jgi:hypothetical protein
VQFTVSVSYSPPGLRTSVSSPLWFSRPSYTIPVALEQCLFKWFRLTLRFHGRLSGVPQTHFLCNEVDKYNLDNFNSFFFLPIFVYHWR